MSELGFFRFGHLPGGRVVLTNDAGEFSLVSADQFAALRDDQVPDELRQELLDKGFLRTSDQCDRLSSMKRRQADRAPISSHVPHEY